MRWRSLGALTLLCACGARISAGQDGGVSGGEDGGRGDAGADAALDVNQSCPLSLSLGCALDASTVPEGQSVCDPYKCQQMPGACVGAPTCECVGNAACDDPFHCAYDAGTFVVQCVVY
jgi:hypothetical protein